MEVPLCAEGNGERGSGYTLQAFQRETPRQLTHTHGAREMQ